MTSDYTVRQLSRGQGPAVMHYYDIPVEEPGGHRIIYHEFDSKVPGPGNVIIANADGANPRVVGRGEESIGHVGSQARWVGANRVAFSPRQKSDPVTTVLNLDSGDTSKLPRTLRSYCESNGVGAMVGGGGSALTMQAIEAVQALHLWDSATDLVKLRLDVHRAHAIHPQRDRFDPARCNFQNAKFSPDGSMLFVVFGTEVYRRITGDQDCPVIKCLLLMSTDGDDVSYLGEFGHHPMWMPDGRAIVAHNRDAEGRQHLMRYALDGSAPEVFLANLPGVHCSFDGAGKRLVTDVFGDGYAEVLLVDVPSGKASTLVRGTHERTGHENGSHPHPQWSRDERRVFFNMADTGVPQLYAVDL